MVTKEKTEIRTHPAIQIIKDRAREASKPWHRIDEAKVGVVVEGGGLRAVISAAVLVALQKMGFRDSIDIIYGESIGCGNAAWFLSGQLDSAIATYWNLVNNFSFINPLRKLTGGEIVSTRFLMKQVETHYPYNYTAFLDSGITLGILAARVDRSPQQKEYNPLITIAEFSGREDLLEGLMAAFQMPFFVGKPYPYRDMQLWDAGIIDKFPVQKAIEDGCTHILAISSSPYDYIPKDYNLLQKYTATPYFNMYNSDIGKAYLQTRRRLRETMDFLRGKQVNQDGPPYIATLALPSGTKRLSTFEIRGYVLRQAALMSKGLTLSTFGSV